MGVSSCARYTLTAPVYKCVLHVPLCDLVQRCTATFSNQLALWCQLNAALHPSGVCVIARLFAAATTGAFVNSENLSASPGTDPFAHCHTHMNCALQQQLLNQRQASPDSVTWMM